MTCGTCRPSACPIDRMWPSYTYPAGMRRVIALAYCLVWAWEEHKRAAGQLGDEPSGQIIFLIDEIESHLHPKWQRSVVPAVLSAMRELNPEAEVQLVAATHSPLIMASIEPEFDNVTDAWVRPRLRRERSCPPLP